MRGDVIHFDVLGIEGVQEHLEGLKESVKKKFLRGAVAKASRIIAKAEKALVPVDTGTLKKSIGSRVYSKKNVAGVIGARRGFERTIGKRKLYPVFTLHLVDTGHKVKGSGKWVPGTQFRSRAYHQTRSQVEQTIRADLAERLAKFRGW